MYILEFPAVACGWRRRCSLYPERASPMRKYFCEKLMHTTDEQLAGIISITAEKANVNENFMDHRGDDDREKMKNIYVAAPPTEYELVAGVQRRLKKQVQTLLTASLQAFFCR